MKTGRFVPSLAPLPTSHPHTSSSSQGKPPSLSKYLGFFILAFFPWQLDELNLFTKVTNKPLELAEGR